MSAALSFEPDEPQGSGLPGGQGGRDETEGIPQGLYVTLPAEELTLEGFAEDGRADTMAPGPLLAMVLGAVAGENGEGLTRLSDDQLIGFLSGIQRMESHMAWARMAALAEFASRPRRQDFAADEVASAFGLTWLPAAREIGYACTVARRLPVTFAALGAGKLYPVHVKIIEADAIWKRGKSDETAEALRSVVKAGHRRTATVGRVEMNGQTASLTRFRVYAPAAIAGIGGLPDTIMDRAVVVRMRRRAPGESVRDYRERTTRPEGEALRGQLAAWAADVAGRVGDPWPDMPQGVADRAADVWESLLMVADLAGGDWPKRAAEACTAFVTGAQDDTGSTGTRLLADLRDVFGDAPQLFTQTILDRLHALGESP
jgi:hypothetical protein